MAKYGVWIPVKDGLPKKDCWVKVTNERKGVEVWDVHFDADRNLFKLPKEGTWSTSYPIEATHYMLMPLTPATIAERKKEERARLKACKAIKDHDDEDEDNDQDDE